MYMLIRSRLLTRNGTDKGVQGHFAKKVMRGPRLWRKKEKSVVLIFTVIFRPSQSTFTSTLFLRLSYAFATLDSSTRTSRAA